MANTENLNAPADKQHADERLAMHKRYLADLALMRETMGARLDDLKLAVGDAALFDQLPELLDPSNFEVGSRTRRNKLRAIYQALIDLPSHAKAIKTLLEDMADLYSLERQALEDYKAYSDATAVERSAPAFEEIDPLSPKFQALMKKIEERVRQSHASSSVPVDSGGTPSQAGD